MRMSAFASPDGTRKYAENANSAHGISHKHFRNFDALTLSSLGMGTYLGSADSDTDFLVEEALRMSVLSGAINVIDTAINYRYQKAERSVGRALKSLIEGGRINRDEIFLSTKNGYLAPDAEHPRGVRNYLQDELIKKGLVERDQIAESGHCMTIPYLRHELERSLSNLQVEGIDLLYLHNSAETQIPVVGRETYLRMLKDAISFFEKARSENKINFYGMASWDCFRNLAAEETHLNLQDIVDLAKDIGGESSHGFRFIQFPYNLAMPEALIRKNQIVNGKESTLLEACLALNIGTFTSVPLLQGRLLADEEGLTKIYPSLTPAQTILQFSRSSPGVIAPLVGHKGRLHVEENIALAKKDPLNKAEFESSFLR